MKHPSWEHFFAHITQKPSLRLAVVGSRHCTDLPTVDAYVQPLHEQLGDRLSLVSGAAKGVDTLARDIAQQRGIPLTEFPANWAQYGRAAGPIRNKQLVQASDAVLAFSAPTSTGTRNTITLAEKQGLPVHVVLLPT